jgi:hypothetical protein
MWNPTYFQSSYGIKSTIFTRTTYHDFHKNIDDIKCNKKVSSISSELQIERNPAWWYKKNCNTCRYYITGSFSLFRQINIVKLKQEIEPHYRLRNPKKTVLLLYLVVNQIVSHFRICNLQRYIVEDPSSFFVKHLLMKVLLNLSQHFF